MSLPANINESGLNDLLFNASGTLLLFGLSRGCCRGGSPQSMIEIIATINTSIPYFH